MGYVTALNQEYMESFIEWGFRALIQRWEGFWKIYPHSREKKLN